MSEIPKKEFGSANECYSYFTKKRLRFYDIKHTPLLTDLQKSISEQARLDCIKHIARAGNQLEVYDDTLLFAVRLFDYVITKYATNSDLLKQQSVAATCLLLATKYNDTPKSACISEDIINAFHVENLTEKEIPTIEVEVMKSIDSNIFCAIPTDFYTVAKEEGHKSLDKEQENIMKALCLMSLLSEECSSFKAESLLAAFITLTCKVAKIQDATKEILGFDAEQECIATVEKAIHMEIPEDFCQRFDGLREFIENAFK